MLVLGAVDIAVLHDAGRGLDLSRIVCTEVLALILCIVCIFVNPFPLKPIHQERRENETLNSPVFPLFPFLSPFPFPFSFSAPSQIRCGVLGKPMRGLTLILSESDLFPAWDQP